MRPTEQEYAPYYGKYIAFVKEDEALLALENSLQRAAQFLQQIPREKADYRYQDTKWTVKELLQHMVDTERVMGYRALRFGRNDQTELAGFDENAYVDTLDLEKRSLGEMVEEYLQQRKASIHLFRSFSPDALLRKGKASGHMVSVRALGFIIVGHEEHHFNILKERYF